MNTCGPRKGLNVWLVAAMAWVPGMAILVEKKSRRMELAVFCTCRVPPPPLHPRSRPPVPAHAPARVSPQPHSLLTGPPALQPYITSHACTPTLVSQTRRLTPQPRAAGRPCVAAPRRSYTGPQ